MNIDGRLVLLFDGTCGPCTRVAKWVRQHDTEGRILVLPNQTAGVCKTWNLSRAEANRSVYLILQDGSRFEGAAAFSRVFAELGGAWRWLASPHRVSPVAALEELVYRWLARNRRRFGWLTATPECEQPGVDCTGESSAIATFGDARTSGPTP